MQVRPVPAPLVLMLIILTPLCGASQVVRVQVLDNARRPAANASVFFVPVDPQGVVLAEPQEATTNEYGIAAVFVSPLWTASGWATEAIAFWAKQGDAESSPEYFRPVASLWRADDLPTVTLYLRPTVSFAVRFRLVDERGAPVANGWVALARRASINGEPTCWVAFWWTDSAGEVKGTFRLQRALVQRFSGEKHYLLVAWHPRKGWAWRSCNLAALRDMTVALTPPQPVTLRFTNCFGEPVAGIKGRLAQIVLPDLPTSLPLPPNPFTFASDEDGVLTVPLPQGAKGMWEWHKETPSDVSRRYRSQGALLALAPGTRWDIQFHEKVTHITGTLVDAKTRKPLSRCPLLVEFHTGAIFSAAGTYWHRTFTNERGRFEARIGTPLFTGTPPLAATNWRGGLIALHLPDGQRWALKLPQTAKPLLGCWRVALPPLAVKPLTGQLVVKAEIKAPFAPQEPKPKALEFAEMLKRAKVFVAAQAGQPKQAAQSLFADAVNCEGRKVTLEFVSSRDGIGTAILTSSGQPVAVRLGGGEWVVTAFIAYPYFPPPRDPSPAPVGAHFFAFLKALPPDVGKNMKKVHLLPHQVQVASLLAVTYSNLTVFRPDALEPAPPEK